MDVDKFNRFFNKIGQLSHGETAFHLRRRYNPHHPPDVIAQETMLFHESQKKLWLEIKTEYLENKDEFMAQAGGDRGPVLKQLQRVIDDEMDSIILGGDVNNE